MLDYAEKITLQGDQVSEEDVERLRKVGWNDKEILEIAALTCYRIFISRMADALGVELTEGYHTLRKDYVDSLMVGKKLL
ncbi:MAG: carboxymuconolactone decarboxylase family protein [Candidatus Binatia bacterium]